MSRNRVFPVPDRRKTPADPKTNGHTSKTVFEFLAGIVKARIWKLARNGLLQALIVLIVGSVILAALMKATESDDKEVHTNSATERSFIESGTVRKVSP